jgi:hypothetical protein
VIASLQFASCVDRLGWVLVHSLWQFALLMLVGFVLQRALQRCSAVTRYGALLATMGAAIIAPVATWCWLPAEPPAAATPIVASRIDAVAIELAPAGADQEARSTPRPIVEATKTAGEFLYPLESLQADDDPFVRDAVAEALLTAPPRAAIPILQEMAAENRAAAWALIRLGDKAESAIIEILAESTFRSSAPGHVIREYYEHWKALPAPVSAAIVKAIRYRVQADAKVEPRDQYGLEVLKLADDSFKESKP